MTTEIKIYVANLGKYNEGFMVGKWVTLPLDEDEMNQLFVDIGVGTFNEDGDYEAGKEDDGVIYEEVAIHDYEAPIRIGEYDSIEKLNEIAELMEDLDEEQVKCACAILEHGCVSTFEEAVEAIDGGDTRIWHENSMEDIAYEWYDETGGIDESNSLIAYVDWEAVGRDMEINGTFIEVEYGLWVEYFG